VLLVNWTRSKSAHPRVPRLTGISALKATASSFYDPFPTVERYALVAQNAA
jgi:hypothetical protein